MIDEQDVQQLRNEIGLLQRKVGATEFSMGIEYLTDLLDTLSAALKVVRAAEYIEKRIADSYFASSPEREALRNALSPFRSNHGKEAGE